MKSLRYRVLGHPHNMDDCLDLAKRSRPRNVTLTLLIREATSDLHVHDHLIGKYSWDFPQHTVCYEKIYGGHFEEDSMERKGRSVEYANRRLQKSLDLLRANGIEILGYQQRFDDTLLAR